jgi:hypothetical protein
MGNKVTSVILRRTAYQRLVQSRSRSNFEAIIDDIARANVRVMDTFINLYTAKRSPIG